MNWASFGAFLKSVFIPLVTVATATMVAFLNSSISQVDHELKQRIAAVDIAIKEARDEREKIDAEREFNFKIYDLVQQSLEEKNERKQEVAKQFVLVMVDGELRRRLLGVLEEGGTPTIKQEAANIIVQEKEFQRDENSNLRTNRNVKPSFDWEDWDYDIFWCTSSGTHAKEQANFIKQELEREGAKGRIRVRELYPSVNSRTGYKVSGYAIRRSENETTQANALEKLAETVLSKKGYPAIFKQQLTSQNTRWYISAFICP
ncbi:hypothetical protein [Pseudoalteromonas sp. MMG005]|uniref:hypothetical protein n=1 Tax=Pseudoalteromonas sp. MMG005 TaxID=2822682 RepID=UPI001B3A5725|nr:hypothetical protein [Pseudoalteromonas sp. MMG005]MBQ4845326.1 hypothetical protein [Pseudoalteromonas sp. MMG005]